MALGVGAYFGEGAYLKKHGIPKPEWKIYQQKVFLNDLYTKQDFLGYEKYRFLMVVNKYFSERFTPVFSKNATFIDSFIFRQNRSRKSV